MDRKLLRKADIFIIAAVIVAAAALWLALSQYQGKLEAVVTVDGEVLRTVDLSSGEAAEFRTGTDPDLLIIARDGAIWVAEAGCRDKLCSACGKLTRMGDTAVCLPARTVITVSGSELDAVTY